MIELLEQVSCSAITSPHRSDYIGLGLGRASGTWLSGRRIRVRLALHLSHSSIAKSRRARRKPRNRKGEDCEHMGAKSRKVDHSS